MGVNLMFSKMLLFSLSTFAGPCSAVSNVSDCRYISDCRSGGRELDPGPVSYFISSLPRKKVWLGELTVPARPQLLTVT